MYEGIFLCTFNKFDKCILSMKVVLMYHERMVGWYNLDLEVVIFLFLFLFVGLPQFYKLSS